MTAWRLANNALDRILRNWLTALWLSVPVFFYLVLVLAAANFRVLDAIYWGDVAGAERLLGARSWQRVIFAVLAILFAANWVAVAWHRFVLLNEGPTGLGPKLYFWPVISYMVFIVLIGLALLVFVTLLILLLGFLAALAGLLGRGEIAFSFGIGDYSEALKQGTVAVVLTVIGTILFVYLFLRFALKLPAIAIGEPLTIGNALGYGRHHRRLLLGLAVGYTVITLLWGLVGVSFENAHWSVAVVMEFGFNWLAFMLSISVITELYMEFVRPNADNPVPKATRTADS